MLKMSKFTKLSPHQTFLPYSTYISSLLVRKVTGHIMWMVDQSMENWSITSVHLVTVSVVEWIMIVVDVIASTIMMMMIASVSVIGKVHTHVIYTVFQ